MTDEPVQPRRWRLFDAMLLVAATAAATLPAKDRWTELAPGVRQVQFVRIFDPGYVRALFSKRMPTARNDSVLIQFEHMVGPAMGPWGFIAWNNRLFDAVQWWVRTHAAPGALGFAWRRTSITLPFRS